MLFIQLTMVLGISYRSFQLVEHHNGACFLADTVGNTTRLQFRNLLSKDPLPLIIFNYLDHVKFKDFPNLNEFLNDSYIDGKINKLLRVQPDGSYKFKLRPGNGYTKLPENYLNYTLDKQEVFHYPVPGRGVYCAYVPKYPHSSKFLVDVGVLDDIYPIDTPRHLDVHLKLAGALLLLIVVLFLVYSRSPKAQLNKSHKVSSTVEFPRPVKLTLGIFQLNLLLNVCYFLAEVLVIRHYDNSFMQSVYFTLHEHVYTLEHSKFDPIFEAFVFALVTGYMYTNKLPKKFYIVLGIYLSSFFTKSVLLQKQIVIPGELQLMTIRINGESFDVLHNSIITGFGLNPEVKGLLNLAINKWSVLLLSYHVLALNIFYPASLLFGFITLFKYKKQNKGKQEIDTRPLSYTLFGYLIVYSLVVKRFVNLLILPNFIFNGISDYGEVLVVIHRFIEKKLFRISLLKYLDILIVCLIWTYIHQSVKKQKTA
jgi:hypothetical protein